MSDAPHDGAHPPDDGRTDALRYPCKQCGAKLTFKPGATRLICDYCAYAEDIPQSQDQVVEHAFEDYKPDTSDYGADLKRFKCNQCGSQTAVAAHVTSFKCAFCGSNQVEPQTGSSRLHRPESLIPFVIAQKQALERFRVWVKSLWFRPNALKKQATPEDLHGVYLPFWTYDSFTHSWYEGERGDHYYEEESYLENGEWKTRRVRRTAWTHVSGQHQQVFDDVPIPGSPSASPKLIREVENWDTKSLVNYSPDFLSGFCAEDYREDMLACWPRAKQRIDDVIYGECVRRVGGDEQRNVNVSTSYLSRTYKLCLFPLWIASYRYQGKPYTYVVNGQTGTVSGNAPLSWIKITLFVVALLGAIAFFLRLRGH